MTYSVFIMFLLFLDHWPNDNNLEERLLGSLDLT